MSSQSRSSENPSAPSAPRNSEEARTLLQQRLCQFGRVGMILGVTFLVVTLFLHAIFDLQGSREASLAQAAACSVSSLLWYVTRHRHLETATLHALDAGATLVISCTFLTLTWTLPIWARPELVTLLCATDFLVFRAFLVPSTTKRTFLLGALVVLLLGISTWVLYSGPKPHPDAPGAAGYTTVITVLSSATVLLTSLTSRTIFGLRQRVREAARLGQYTLLEKIGEGGMGIVYRAQHAMLRRPTAVKLLPAERAGERNVARFEREVQLTSLLTHPNTVAVYDYGRTADGVFYYAMEYLDGIDLEMLVRLDGPQEPGRVIHLLKQVCGALEEAHQVGLIHRDVKPANVILCQRGGTADVVKVLDFGLVKSLEERDALHSAADQIIGTPLYLSPEAISDPKAVDARSDLYAVGALGYYLLVGAAPFSGRSAVEVCAQHLHTAPVPPHERLGREHASELDRVLLACLEKSPAARPASAAGLREALEQCPESALWTQNRAHDWWQRREKNSLTPSLRAERAPPDTSLEATIDVDLQARARLPWTRPAP